MPLKSMPSFKATSDRQYQIPQPGIGGLNLKDLEYEQGTNQTPYMLNMMYRNGSFGKRYGQKFFFDTEISEIIHDTFYFDKKIVLHAGTHIYFVDEQTKEVTQLQNVTVADKKGLFITYAQNLYFICGGTIYEYKIKNGSYVWGEIEPYIPEVLINCDPKGPKDNGNSNAVDDYNIIGLKFKEIYHGDGTSKDYYIYGDDDNIINWNATPIIEVNGVATTDFTVDAANKKISFSTAPSKGNLNVEITLTLKESALKEDRDRILASKYWVTFGGNNNSCLFLAGGGNSKYFYSNAYDATYFPENNWAILGNSETDITGFGLQYNVLIVFKANEMYSIYSYTQTSSTTIVEEEYGLEAFKALLVNPRIGCDCPYTIELINNQLTWFNSVEGVCTLVSTNIVDERNVRPISRNIDRKNNMGVKGILDYDEELETIQSIDFDGKYFLAFPKSGMCYVWDYDISPFTYTSSKVTDSKNLSWFLFDHFNVKEFLKVGKELYYVSTLYEKNLVNLNNTFVDLDFDGDGEDDGINAYYMTPFLQFDAVAYLKTVKNLYIQCRGDTATSIDVYYYTDETLEPEQDTESIKIGGKIWSHFSWDTFEWLTVNWANTFRRRCGLKKIQMASFYFENKSSEIKELTLPFTLPARFMKKYDDKNYVSCAGHDMSITHIALDYQIVRTIK